jgi:hypothetical protein
MQDDADLQQGSMRREEWDAQREQYHQFASQMRVLSARVSCVPLPGRSHNDPKRPHTRQTKYDLTPQEPKDTV